MVGENGIVVCLIRQAKRTANPTKKTSINQGGQIISSMDIHYGLAICILIYLTFFLQIIASVYFEEAIGIFLYYFILKKGTDYKFRDLRQLGIFLIVISLLEVIGRIFIVITQWGQPSFIPIWTTFYIGIAITFMVPYLIFGYRTFKNSSFLLEEA